jgi:hypothetical protein
VLKETIPNFHNLSLRYYQFEESLKQGNKERLSEAADIVNQLKNTAGLLMNLSK